MSRTRQEQNWERLKDQIIEALTGLHEDLRDPGYKARQPEIVSLFVLRHLLRTVRADRPITQAAQVGLQVSLPPLRGADGSRRRPASNQDLVVWPRPGMSCWDAQGRMVNVPLAILEWTCRDNVGPGERGQAKQTKFQNDIAEMKLRTAEWQDLTGFCILVDRTGTTPQIDVRLIRSDAELQLPIGER